ncbi:lysine biosynthesis protein LysX/ribosomal protein S6 modification protein RimK [Aeropyrum pernix]|uniref:Lysine biosynthesis protein LysX/ribosomal protein S6 modification protein RimK n=1 Tax=Aeropyrum pernix TaxID=56636 RepID=A0A401HB07_AERPX|nr:lysine biosynthesis protein LysX [Aeropyrum pernix]GBF09646.1 lysine biosynthesis protein LysX/ribosomal protein S6 modification protein RimK [Aeropyrum pernix]
MSPTASIVFFYDIARLDEKMLLEELRKRARVRVIHTAARALPLGEPPREAGEAELAVARGVSGRRLLYSALAAESWGLETVNSSHAIMASQDKVWSHMLLSRRGVPTPRSYAILDPRAVPTAAEAIGFPAVFKPARGSWGKLVSLLRDKSEASLLSEALEYVQGDLKLGLVQEYVDKPGRDIRSFCIGDTVPAAIYRYGSGFATNLSAGGRAAPAPVTGDVEDLTLRACEALGVEVGGVDIVESTHDGGLLVLEVNPSTEFKNTVRVTGVNVAALIADYVVSRVRR